MKIPGVAIPLNEGLAKITGLSTNPFVDFASADGDFSNHSGIHVDGGSNTGAVIIEGDAGGKLILGDSGGGVNDKIMEFEVDGGVLTIRSLNDDLTTLINNIIVADLATGNVGINEGTPVATLDIEVINTGIAGIRIAGVQFFNDASGTSGTGTSLVNFFDGTGNKQFLIADSDNLTSTTRPALKITTGSSIVGIDALHPGNATNGVLSIGGSEGLTQAIVKNHLGIATTAPFTNAFQAGTAFSNHSGLHIFGKASWHGAIVVEGALGGKLILGDTGGGVNDKAFEWEVDGGIMTGRSINDDLTTLNDNVIVHDLGTGDTGFGIAAATGKVHIDQASATGAKPVLVLDQGDVSEEMIEFITTIGVGNAIEAIAAKVLTTTHFVKCTIPGGLTVYFPVGTIA